jgi:hypothetical protein
MNGEVCVGLGANVKVLVPLTPAPLPWERGDDRVIGHVATAILRFTQDDKVMEEFTSCDEENGFGVQLVLQATRVPFARVLGGHVPAYPLRRGPGEMQYPVLAWVHPCGCRAAPCKKENVATLPLPRGNSIHQRCYYPSLRSGWVGLFPSPKGEGSGVRD